MSRQLPHFSLIAALNCTARDPYVYGKLLGRRSPKTALRLLMMLVLVGLAGVMARGTPPELSPQGSPALRPFLGRWDLTIQMPHGERPSWIDVSEHDGRPKLLMVGIVSSAQPIEQVEVKRSELIFVSPKDDEGFPKDTTFRARLVGGRLLGTAEEAGGVSWHWTGRRAPSLARTAAPKWGKPIRLFNGRDFSGWRFLNPTRKSNWRIEGGDLVTDGRGTEMITLAKFRDFKLHIEFNCGPKANSGVYLRGRYEVQIETDSAAETPSHHTGAIYGFLPPNPELPRIAGKWQSYDITLIGRTVTVVQNGVTVINHQQIPGITGGALDSHEGLPGPIYLQGTEEGRIAFRNIVITPAE